MGMREDWEVIEPLGEGGQSQVSLVRRPKRRVERATCLKEMRTALDGDKRADLAIAIWAYARPDLPSELGALKVFDKTRRGGAAAAERLEREILLLEQKRPGLPELLDSNKGEHWIVTEFFAGGTLEKHPLKYKGQAATALRAFRSLVETVASALHKDKIVHRDIKPANVFIGSDGTLIPGDLGIAYVPDQAPRMTHEGERVGPWEYMPQWADSGARFDKVEPSFDVYMLGKLLWCMVAGSLRLPREYHRRPDFDLTLRFPNDSRMRLINSILDKCLVEEAHLCLSSAQELLRVVDETLAVLDRGLPLLDKSGNLDLPCHVCGTGYYRPSFGLSQGLVRMPSYDDTGRVVGEVRLQPFTCNVCTNLQLFAPGNPKEAAQRGWTPWGS